MKIYYYIRLVQRNTISRIANKVLDFWCAVGIKMKSRFRDTGHSLSLDNSLSPTKGKGPLEERQVLLLVNSSCTIRAFALHTLPSPRDKDILS